MKALIITLIGLVYSVASYGQISPEKLLQQCKSSYVSMSYNYSIEGEMPVCGSGIVSIQGNCFTSEGDGIRLFCDGANRWTVDDIAREIYIEAVAEGEEAESVISGYLRKMSDYKVEKDRISGSLKDAGQSIHIEISNIKILPSLKDLDTFRFDTSSINANEWIINDLR